MKEAKCLRESAFSFCKARTKGNFGKTVDAERGVSFPPHPSVRLGRVKSKEYHSPGAAALGRAGTGVRAVARGLIYTMPYDI